MTIRVPLRLYWNKGHNRAPRTFSLYWDIIGREDVSIRKIQTNQIFANQLTKSLLLASHEGHEVAIRLRYV